MAESILKEQAETVPARRDIHQQVTDIIVKQLEEGTIPWNKPWKGDTNRLCQVPKNFTTGKKYRGINILLLWGSAVTQNFSTQDWGSFKQWQEKKESIRRGEKGSLVVYYDFIERQIDGELKEIPFLKTSFVFNRCQLASFKPDEDIIDLAPLIERIEKVDQFVKHTSALIEYKGNSACYIPSIDTIYMPPADAFIDTETSTATESYYSTLLHELTHWTGSKERLNRQGGKKFGDKNYGTEELVAELGAAFLCAELEITRATKLDHASYIDCWLKRIKENKHCLFTAAGEASKACGFLQNLQLAKNTP